MFVIYLETKEFNSKSDRSSISECDRMEGSSFLSTICGVDYWENIPVNSIFFRFPGEHGPIS